MMNNNGMMGNNMGNDQMMQQQQQMMQQQQQQQQMMVQQQMMQQQMAAQMQQNMMAQQMLQQQMMQAQKQAAMNNILNNMQNPGVSSIPGQDTNSMPTAGSSAQPQGQGFSVIFRASGATGQASAPIMVQCMPNDRVADVIEKYRNKANDRDDTKKFIFNAKNLAPSLTVAEAGITNNANIFVVATKGIKGAF